MVTGNEVKPSGRKQLPTWIVAVAVLATAGATAWAAWQTGLRGPQVSWQTATDAVSQVWASDGAEQPAPAGQPNAFGTPGGANPARTVAGLPGAPRIMFGAQRPHPDRGACTTCHSVLMGNGGPVPNIQSFSVRPHEYRGVCSNCHQVTVAGAFGVAATRAGAPGAQGMRVPNEADWRGMEVRAVDQGVVVTKADGIAGRVGVQPGDVVASVNGGQIRSMTDFITQTQDGNLPQGTVIARRNDQRLAFEIAPNVNGANAAVQPPPAAAMPPVSNPQPTPPPQTPF